MFKQLIMDVIRAVSFDTAIASLSYVKQTVIFFSI